MPSQDEPAIKLAVHMAEPAIKRIKSFLTCCAKIGAHMNIASLQSAQAPICNYSHSVPALLLACNLMQMPRAGSVVLIEATASQMNWRVINSAKSACLLISMQDKLFDHFVLYQQQEWTTSVLLKVRPTPML